MLFVDENTPFQKVYDGQNFPAYVYEEMLCFIRTEYNGKTEFLYLPCEEEAIDKAFARLGAPTPDDVELSWEDICIDSVVIKRSGGWRTESYNEFYMEKGNVLEQLPSFHWEKLFELQQSMSQSERLLALSVEFWMSAMDDLQEVLASEHLFEIIAALQTIGAHKYHDFLLKIMNDDFGDVRFPLDDNQIEQMQPKIEDANRAFWKNKGAEAEFRGAVTNFLITNLDASGHVFEGIDQS